MADGTSIGRAERGKATYTIGEAAERLGVSVHTLRYYENAGLMAGVTRRANGHRTYDETDIDYLDLLCCLRRTGLPIAEMRRFSDMVRAGTATAADRFALLASHRQTIEKQRSLLDRAAALVDEKLERYREMIG